MFYFKITVRSKVGETRKSKNVYREFTRMADLGEMIAAKMQVRAVTSVSVTRINQGHYVRKTRGAE